MKALDIYIKEKVNFLLEITRKFYEEKTETFIINTPYGRKERTSTCDVIRPQYQHLDLRIQDLQREIIKVKSDIGLAIAQDHADYFEKYEHDRSRVYDKRDIRIQEAGSSRIINFEDVPLIHYNEALPVALQKVQELDGKVLQFFLTNYQE